MIKLNFIFLKRFFSLYFIAGDIPTVLTNVGYRPLQTYLNYISGALEKVPSGLQAIVTGLTGGLKNNDGLLDKLLGGVKGATGGIIRGVQDSLSGGAEKVLQRECINWEIEEKINKQSLIFL